MFRGIFNSVNPWAEVCPIQVDIQQLIRREVAFQLN